MQNVVELQGIVKRFGGQLANDGVDFDLRQGEVHALLGENGAGKTTLMRVLYGLYRADAGKIIVRGQETSMASPRDAIALGIGMVHQQFMLVPTLTVAENIVLGMPMPREPLLDLRGTQERIQAVSANYGLEVDPRVLVSRLSVGAQQRVEIAKALYRGAEIVILDEPTSVLTPQEADKLFRIIRALCQTGKSVVFISHKLDEVMEISDRVTVLRDGRRVGVSEAAGTNPSELAKLMVGREVDLDLVHRSIQPGEPVLLLDHLGVCASDGRPLLSDVSLHVCAGEILGVAGVAGNGQTELAEAVTGLRQASHGRVLICGKDMTRGNPRAFIEGGVAHIPEDRDTRGLALGASLAENLVLGRHAHPPFTRCGLYSPNEVSTEARRLLRQFDVRPPQPSLRAAALSGGNRQKLVLARELAKNPRLLIAVQPTRGLDVMATSYVRRTLLEQRESGKGILLISTELDEIMALSDRVAVLFAGRLMGILPIAEATPERVGLMMAGSVPAPEPTGGSMMDGSEGERRGAILSSLATRLAGAAMPVVIALVAGGLLIAVSHTDPVQAYSAMLSGAFGSINGLAETLVKATPLLLASLGVSVAFRSRLFNVGAEGQLYIGALAATLVAFRTGGLAPGLAIALVILAGALGGGAWGLIPGYLKARFGLDEIIVTIMLNYVATLLISFLVRNNLRDPSGYLPHSAPLPSATALPVIVAGTRLHAGLFIALAAALLVFILLWRTRVGYELRMVGTGPEAARAAGINVAQTTVVAMTISGALAGLAGMSEVAGVHHRLLEHISPGYGFTAIAIALLGGNSPLGIILASFLFAGLDVGSSAMQTRVGVPVHVVTVIQGAIILLVVGREAFGRLHRFGARSSQGKA